MPHSKTEHESTKKSMILGFDFELSCFRAPLFFWLGIVKLTANPGAVRKS